MRKSQLCSRSVATWVLRQIGRPMRMWPGCQKLDLQWTARAQTDGLARDATYVGPYSRYTYHLWPYQTKKPRGPQAVRCSEAWLV